MRSSLKIAALLVACVGLGAIVAPAVHAAPWDVFPSQCTELSKVCSNASDQKLFGPGSVMNNILNAFVYVIGAIAVIMMVVGAFRFVTSSGDSAAITSAKNTILYSVIGLIVAAMASAIINFVLSRI